MSNTNQHEEPNAADEQTQVQQPVYAQPTAQTQTGK